MANKYRWACQKVSYSGPDRVLLGRLAWAAVASPSIRFGCETIPFADCHVKSIERCQSQLLKSLLHLSPSCPNIVAQTEFGEKMFRLIQICSFEGWYKPTLYEFCFLYHLYC